MPALSGQLFATIPDANGAAGITVAWFWNPANGNLRNNPQAWTAPGGTVYPAGTGALILDNQLGRPVKVAINDAAGNMVKQINVPQGGRTRTANQLSNDQPPAGPFTTAAHFNGLTFDLS